MRRFNKLLKSGTSLMLVFAMLFGMCGAAFAVGETETKGGYVALGDFVTEDALADFKDGTVLGGDFMRVADLYDELVANQSAIADADVIALGIGNADINIYAVNNILSAIGADAVGFDSAICDDEWKNLDTALENCDALTRNIALQLYDKLEPVVREKLSDQEMIETVLDVLVYTAVSFVVNYSAVLEEVATVNEDATVMIVGLVNMLDGMAINFNGQEIELGKYFGYVVDALNVYLAAVPTEMQMNGEYENVTFLYAEASDAEVEYVKPVLTKKLRESIIAVVNGKVFPALLGELNSKIPAEVNGVKVDIELGEVTLEMVNNYDNLTKAGEIISCAIYLAFEEAILEAAEPEVLSLNMENGVDGLIGGLDIDVDMSTLADDVMDAVLAYYEAWQFMDAEAEDSITDACYKFMLGKVEETVKAEAEGGEAYVDALNEKLIAELNKELCENHQVPKIESVEWADLWNSLIAEDYEAKAKDLFYKMLKSVEAYDIILAHAYEVAPDTDEFKAELDKKLMAEYETLVAQEAEKTGKTPEEIKAAFTYEDFLAEVDMEQIEKEVLASDDFGRILKDQVNELWVELWVTAWDEALGEMYTEANTQYNDGVKTLNDNKANLPLALLEIADKFVTLPTDVKEWVIDMREELTEEKAEIEALVDAWVNEAAAELVIEKIDTILPEVFAGDDINSLMYLLGRLLAGDGLGRYITDEGSDAICDAMNEAYGDDVTVQDEISDKVEKLIDLVLQYGPKAMDKVGAIEKLRTALDVMVEKLDGRGGSKVDKVVSEIESILDEIEAIANGESDKTAEDLVNAYIDLDATIEELRALIHGEEIPEDSEGAIREFIDAAAHGDYEINYQSYYVAVGDDSAEGYAELLAAELGLNNDFGTVVSDSVAASIENLDAEIIAEADLITVGFSNNTFLKYMASQMNARLDGEAVEEMDWSVYVGAEGVKYVEKALNEIQEILAKDLHKKVLNYGYLDELLMLAVESYAYAAADYAFNYPVLMEEIREINPDALIVSVGMSNSVADIELDLSGITEIEGYEFDLGEYIEYLVAAVNGEAKVYAMLNENVAYVHAPDVDIVADEDDYDDVLVFIGQIASEDGFADLIASEEGNEYIKDQIYEALNITHGLRLGDVDLDGDVDWADLAMMYDHTMQWYELTGEQLYVANLDGDPEVTFVDVAILYDYLMEWNTILD